MKKGKQKRKPAPSFPQVSLKTQTARAVDHLTRGARIGQGGGLVRITEEPNGFVSVYSGRVGKIDPSAEVDRAFPALNEGETGIRPAVERCPYTPIERRAKESNGRDEAEKAKARAFVSENKARRREQVASFYFSFQALLTRGLFAQGVQIANIPGLEPIARLVNDCSLVGDRDACRILHRLGTNADLRVINKIGTLDVTIGGMDHALLRQGADPYSGRDNREALLFAVLDAIRDLQNKRDEAKRRRQAKHKKTKRRGKRKK